MKVISSPRVAVTALLVILSGSGLTSLLLFRSGTSALDPLDSSGPQKLSSEGQSMLRAYIADARFSESASADFRSHQPDVMDLYGSFNYGLPWIHGGRPRVQARTLIGIFKQADNEGLNPADYDGPALDVRLTELDRMREPPESDLIRFDLAITVMTMRYVSDLHRGRVNPRSFHYDLDIGNRDFKLSEFLRENLVNAPHVVAVMRTVEPPFPIYRRTLAALRTYQELSNKDDGALLPASAKPIRPGDLYAGVPRLIRLLHLVGDLSDQDAESCPDAVYGVTLSAAVKRFQHRHGLDSTGFIDAQTLKELNTPLDQRVIQLELTLERLRWLPHEFAGPPIVVNIPEFRLRVDDEQYHWVLSMGVVVGRAYKHKTPVFASQLKSVIFRPYWNVPLSIQRAELLPEIRKDPSYLVQHSYEVVDHSGTVVSEGNVTKEIEDQLRSGKLAIRQRPGDDNALGLIKFEFPNAYDVYMHGTPAVQLFSRSRRDFSHGCIRVEDPVALAAWVLRDKPEWDVDHIRAAMNGDETLEVKLKNPIPVLILYGTAVVTETGEVDFYRDIYGYDAELEQALAKGYPYGD